MMKRIKDHFFTHFSCILTFSLTGAVHPLWLPPIMPEGCHQTQEILADANSIGKTHFIIGPANAPEKNIPSIAQPTAESSKKTMLDGIPLNCDGHVCTVLFDKFYDTLETLIKREQRRIFIAAYMFTDKRLVQWLIEAHERGVSIEIITDLSCLRERSNKLGDLYESGIGIYICMPERKGARSSLMHNKFMLFESNIYGKKIIWTGSANMTHSALGEIHHENVLIVDDPQVYKEYERQFTQIKKHSERYEDCTITNAALHEKIRISKNQETGKKQRLA